jgi:CRISPR-associated protein Cas5d
VVVFRSEYPFMTPSAARGVLDAILYEPQMRWHVRRITALRPEFPKGFPQAEADQPYRLVQVRRNEIASKVLTHNVNKWVANPRRYEPYRTDAGRPQRNSLILQHVAYRIDASPELTERANAPRAKPEGDEDRGPDTVAKYAGMFERRVVKGQCFHRPYLGCREFAANFAPTSETDRPLASWSGDLGLLLYDVRFGADGQSRPGFFMAIIREGVVDCDTEPPGKLPGAQVLGWGDERGAA